MEENGFVMEELRVAARARELSVIRKRKAAPFLVMESRTGKTVGMFTDIDLAMAAVLKYDPVPVFDKPEAVKWHWDVEYVVFPKVCPNGEGPTCLCLDQTATYLCAVPQCNYRAACRGCCSIHFGQLKVFGDLTKQAIAKTALLAENGEFDLDHLPDYKRVVSIKTVIPTEGNKKNLTALEIQKATANMIGMTVIWTGSEYLLVDKDGIVLDRVVSKGELFEFEED